ncbi:hypothetical protein E2C01_047244 [Portunus trituberculatus]|uniref:Uncharacterized protein n=1 Tax=Portunus trituberculatus TaxID=210409 RepID=A0A5B7G7F8_PORTR|nr:hypothetical protein [Portunus trituberculatus]
MSHFLLSVYPFVYLSGHRHLSVLSRQGGKRIQAIASPADEELCAGSGINKWCLLVARSINTLLLSVSETHRTLLHAQTPSSHAHTHIRHSHPVIHTLHTSRTLIKPAFPRLSELLILISITQTHDIYIV